MIFTVSQEYFGYILVYPSNAATIKQRFSIQRLSNYRSTSSYHTDLSPSTALLRDLRAMDFQRTQQQHEVFPSFFHKILTFELSPFPL
jgi:hypothetical protein